MRWQFSHYALLPALVMFVALGLAYYAWQRRRVVGAHAFTLLMSAIALWTFSYGLELLSVGIDAKLFWAQVQYIGIVIVPVAWACFAFQVSYKLPVQPYKQLALLMIVPLVTLALVWTNQRHGLIWSRVSFDPDDRFPALTLQYGSWFWIHSIYAYSLMLTGTAVLMRSALRSLQLYRRQMIALLVGAVAPWIGNAIYIFHLGPIANLDLTPFMFTLSGAALAWSLFRFHLLDVVPVAHEAVIAGMRDGIIVLNGQHQVVDLNPAARAIFGSRGTDMIGHSINKILPAQADLIEQAAAHDQRVSFVLDVANEQRHYDLAISALHNDQMHLIGYLLVFYDTTERVRSEQALRMSEKRYRAVSELSSDYAYALRLEADGRIELEWVTDAFITITGFTGEEIQARGGWITLIHPDERADAKDFARSVVHGEVVVNETRIVTKSGETRWLRNYIKPEWDEHQQRVVRVLGASRDITARKRTDQALKTSEQQQRALLAAIPDMMFRIDVRGTYLDVDIKSLHIVGDIDTNMIIGKTIYDILPENVAQQLAEAIRHTLATNTVEILEYQLFEHGQCYDYEARISVCGPDEVLAIVRDITSRKQAEQALREQNAYLAALHATTIDIMNRLQVDDVLEAIVLRATALVGTQHGYIYLVDRTEGREDELRVHVGAGIFKEYIGYRIKRNVGVSGRVWQTGKPVAIDNYSTWSNRASDVRWEQLRASVGVPLTSGNQVIGVIGLAYTEPDRKIGQEQIEILSRFAQLASIALDNARLYTTAQQELIVRKQAEEELARARDHAVEVARLKSEFLAIMSHELKTPLNAIIGFTEFTLAQQAGPLNEQQQDNLQRVERNARDLLYLINTILDMSKIDAGRMQLMQEHAVLEEIILSTIRTVETLAQAKQIKIRVEQPQGPLPPICGDITRLQQIVLNLLSNAVKFTSIGGSITIALECGTAADLIIAAPPSDGSLEGQWIALSVQDTGIGIAEDEQERVWSEFYQIDSSTTRQYTGTGLGLAIVKRLTLLMQGHVGLRSAVGCGSTFTIWLPLPAKIDRPLLPQATHTSITA